MLVRAFSPDRSEEEGAREKADKVKQVMNERMKAEHIDRRSTSPTPMAEEEQREEKRKKREGAPAPDKRNSEPALGKVMLGKPYPHPYPYTDKVHNSAETLQGVERYTVRGVEESKPVVVSLHSAKEHAEARFR